MINNVFTNSVVIDIGNKNAAPLIVSHGNPDNTTALVLQGRQAGGRSDVMFRDETGRDIAKISSHNSSDQGSNQNHGLQVYARNANDTEWYSPFVIYTLLDKGVVDVSGDLIVNSRAGLGGLLRTDKLRLQSPHVPSSSADSGEVGDIAWDENYLYVCVASNKWKRTSLNNW